MVDGRVTPQVFIKMGLCAPKCKTKQLKQWFPYIIATIASKQFIDCCDHVEILRSTMRIALSRRSQTDRRHQMETVAKIAQIFL